MTRLMNSKPRILRWILIAFGTAFLGLGIVGIFLPLLPTTPLLLLAAACYARSSERFYHWLLNHRWFGHHVKSYRYGHGIPTRAKAVAIILLWSTIALSAVVVVTHWWGRGVLFVIATGITIFLITRPTRKNDHIQ